MATNPYFSRGNGMGSAGEQNLIQSLITESIQVYGQDIVYLPRTSVREDEILGEDVLSKYTNAFTIEMYLQNVQGWNGSNELFSKFGIQMTDNATFVVSRRRWDDSYKKFGDANQLPVRPMEGDLLYFARTRALFEIKFVEHLDPFLQLGKFYIYSLQCELYRYSSETIETGIEDIDTPAQLFTQDPSFNRLVDETGVALVGEGYEALLHEESLGGSKAHDDTPVFEREARKIVDFSVTNPFGDFVR